MPLRDHVLTPTRAAILLRAIEPVGEAIVGGDVIDLRGGLVVPGAPGLRAIHGDHRALVAREHHAVAVFGIDPELVIVVAAGRALDGNPRLAGVERHVGRGVDVVGAVGVGGIDGDLAEVPAAAPEPLLAIDQLPRCAGVVGDVDAAGGLGRRWRRAPRPRGRVARRRAEIIHNRPEAVGIAGRDGDADLADEVVVGQAAGQLMPGVAAVGGFIQAAAGHIGGRIDRPWRTARGPQRCVERARILGIDGQIDRADIVGIGLLEQNLLPVRAAVGGAIDAALGVGVVDVAESRYIDAVGIGGVDDDAADLARVFEADVVQVLPASVDLNMPMP